MRGFDNENRRSISHIFDAKKAIQVMLGKKGRKRDMRALHQSICMVLDDLEPTCSAEFPARSNSNIYLNCVPILASYFCENRKGKDCSEIRHERSVRRPCDSCLRTMEDIQQ